MRCDMRIILLLAGRIDDKDQHTVIWWISRARHHQIIENTALRIQELRIALLAWHEIENIGGNQRFQRPRNGFVSTIRRHQQGLAHMRDIEQASTLACPIVLSHDPSWILHGHVIAGKADHLATGRHMGVVQWCLQQRDIGISHGAPQDREKATLFRQDACQRPLCRWT